MILLREVEVNPPGEATHEYPWNVTAVARLYRLRFETPVTFFVGDNGSGKSTVLEALAVKAGCHPEGGSRHANYSPRHSNTALAEAMHGIWNRPATDSFFFRAETFSAYAEYLEMIDGLTSYGGRSLHGQSHGESFLSTFGHRLQNLHGWSLYLFDEPESALSVIGQFAFLRLLNDWVRGNRVQVIAATHSPILLAFPGAMIYNFDVTPIAPISYTDTPAYRLTRAFLADPAAFMHTLFQPE
ncbi:MAG: AAA family ATPase [Firmicutes bacterium]|nr:AAA family ATPase [Bacillota bacterium]